jgi:hypothetical protein
MIEIIAVSILIIATILAIGKYDYEKSLKNKH